MAMDATKDELVESQSNKTLCLIHDDGASAMGWSNKIIALNCAMDFAREQGSKLAINEPDLFTNTEYPDLETNLNHFVGYSARRNDLLLDPETYDACDSTLTWSSAFYRMRGPDGAWDQCFIHPLSPDLLSRGRRALDEQGLARLPSVHHRGLDGQCEARYSDRSFLCPRAVPAAASPGSPCAPARERLRRRYGAADFVVYSDGQGLRAAAELGRPDSHDFFTQYAMMALSPLHVGNVLSSVDLLIAAWRDHLHGPGSSAPHACYG